MRCKLHGLEHGGLTPAYESRCILLGFIRCKPNCTRTHMLGVLRFSLTKGRSQIVHSIGLRCVFALTNKLDVKLFSSHHFSSIQLTALSNMLEIRARFLPDLWRKRCAPHHVLPSGGRESLAPADVLLYITL
jgi:hypothetical protein